MQLSLEGPDMKSKKDYTIVSVQRALDVLKIFDGPVHTFTLTELSNLSGIGKSTMLRIVYTLCESGFLIYDEEMKRYSLGILMYRLGVAKQNSIAVQPIALHYLRSLSKQTNMICYLGIRQEDQVTMLEQSLPDNAPGWSQLMTHRGGSSDLYATGIGRLLLSRDSDQEVMDYLNRVELKKITPDTITDKGEILQLVQKARREKFDKNMGGTQMYVGSVCAPVWNCDNHMVAAISLCGIKDELFGSRSSEYEALVKKTALDISHELGYSG